MTPGQIINALKSDGKYFAAGAAARSYGHDDGYGCHFGMRSTRDFAISEYKRGYEAKGA